MSPPSGRSNRIEHHAAQCLPHTHTPGERGIETAIVAVSVLVLGDVSMP